MRTTTVRRRAGLAALLVATLLPAAVSQAAAPAVTRIATGGFGDRQNSFAWSMAWFKGKLYVGTARNFLCVEGATLDFYFPNLGFYKTRPEPEMSCPADRYDLDLRAEIWRLTPETGAWTRVFRSPNDIPNPRAPGRFVARDIGFRGMVVHRDAAGNETLYAGGVSADEIIPELKESNPPRILRTTDGTSFTPLGGSPGVIETTTGPNRPMGYRAMVVHDGRLFVTASNSLTGDGVVMEVENPSSATPTFVQVSPNTMQVFEMTTFNGSLYVGVGDTTNNAGYSVWRTAATGTTKPFAFTPVITGGAGRGPAITSVVSMHVFGNRLYVGSSGWYNTLFPASELVRINPDDSWDLVAGSPRLVGQQFKSPISGQGDGFNNTFNAHFWRMQDFSGALHLGTNDSSWAFRNVPAVNLLLGSQFGFDVFGSCDGRYWFTKTQNAFGDGRFNFGARTLAVSPAAGFVGSANHVQGASVWRASNGSICGPASSASASSASATPAGSATPGSSAASARLLPVGLVAPPAASGDVARPRRLLGEPQACGTVLSWDASPGAARYRVLRSEYRQASVRVEPPPPLWGPDLTAGMPRPAPLGSRTAKSAEVSVPGPETAIATITGTSFVDRGARPGVRYRYSVAAATAAGATSEPSNTAFVPLDRPAQTFGATSAAIDDVARRGKLAQGGDGRLQRALSDARGRFEGNDATEALRILDQLQARITLDRAQGGEVTDALTRDDLADTVFRLRRSIEAAGACGPR